MESERYIQIVGSVLKQSSWSYGCDLAWLILCDFLETGYNAVLLHSLSLLNSLAYLNTEFDVFGIILVEIIYGWEFFSGWRTYNFFYYTFFILHSLID